NPERIADLTDRLDRLEKLKRKYGPTLTAVLDKQSLLATELANLEADGQDLESLAQSMQQKEIALVERCEKLTQARREAAVFLKSRLLDQFQALAMPGVSFDIILEPIAYSREGSDEIEFLFSANPGEPLKPLSKVASGGELSR